MAVKELKDFSRGYSTELLPDDVPDNMLQTVKNIYFDGKLRKRRGRKTILTDETAGAEIVGHFFCSINDLGVTIKAVEISSVIKFYSNYSGSFVEIDASFTWSGSGEIRFAALDAQIICVDSSGTNAPAIIYYDSAMKISTYDERDIREIEDAFWTAGQYDDSETSYTDDTTDAQDEGTADFIVATATDDDGFYISGSKVFSKIELKTTTQMAGSPVAEYAYWDGDAWQTFTPGTVPTWTAAAGDRVIEYNLPDDWSIWLGDDSVDSVGDTVPGGMTGTYVIRVRFTTHPTVETTCAYIEVSQTRAVTWGLFNEIPTDVVIHNSRVFLIHGNAISYSDYGLISGYDRYYAEYFEKGGPQINAVKSTDSGLLVVKEEAISKMSGTSPQDFTIELVATDGTADGNTCAVVQGFLCFSSGTQLYLYSGSSLLEIGSHVIGDIPAAAYAVEAHGFYWLVSSSQILVFDPATMKTLPSGKSYVSVWKFDNTTQIKGIVKYIGTNQFSDTKLKNRIVGYTDGTANLICLEYGEQFFDETETTIEIIVETKMYSFGLQTENKIYKRVKPLVSISGDWTFSVQTDRDSDIISATLASGAGPGYHSEDLAMPYTVDSETLSFKLVNKTVNDCVIYALSVDVDLRPY